MKRIACLCVWLIALVVALGITPVLAQQETQPTYKEQRAYREFSAQSTYTVQPNDTLWELAGSKLDDPLLWKEIYKANPFLQQPGRKFTKNGKIIVLIKPNERLAGLGSLNITAHLAPLEQLQAKPVVIKEVPRGVRWALIVLSSLLVLALICYLVARYLLGADPVTSGQAVVPGGVITEAAARTRFQEMASRAFLAQTGRPVPAQDFTILQLTAGRIWGILNVRYADGKETPRRLNGERAFRARVRFPNGKEEVLYMLQGCGNDLRYGGISRYLPGRGFRFEEDQQAATQPPPAPEPERVVAPAQQSATSAAQAPAQEATPSVEDGTLSIEFKEAGENDPRNMLRLTGVEVNDLTFVRKGREITIRFREVQTTS